MIRVVVVLIGVALSVTGCTSAPTAPGSPPPATSVPAARLPDLGHTTCGSSEVAVVLGKKEVDLASCSGQLFNQSTPAVVYLSPGQTVSVHPSDATIEITLDNPRIASIAKGVITATRTGRSSVRFANFEYGCSLVAADGSVVRVASAKCVVFVLVVR